MGLPPRALNPRSSSLGWPAGCPPKFAAYLLRKIIPAEVTEIKEDTAILRTSFGELSASVSADSVPAHGNVTCSIRPEAFVRANTPESPNLIKGSIQDQVFLGDQAQHVVQVNDELSVRVLELNPGEAPASGEISLSIDPGDVIMLQD